MTSYRNSDPRPPIMQGSPPPAEWRVPLMDWDRPPWNRWTFQNISQILPTAPVHRGSGPVIALPEDKRDIGGLHFEAVNGEAMSVDEMLDETYTDGFIVVKGGKVIHESYHNGMAPHTLHLSQSVAKSVTASVAGILIGKGLLNPEAPITDYLPELKGTGWNGAKLQHLFDMASGTRYSEEYTDRTSDVGTTDVACGWKPVPPDADPDFNWPSCVWEQIVSLKARDAEHGSRFEYRSIETDVIAHAMERVTGRRLPQLISDEMWSKIGAEQDACFTVDASGYALACGGFNAALRDYARFALLHLNNGVSAGMQIIPEDWITDIRSGPHGLFSDAGREFLPNGHYRNQFWIEDAARETVLCLGVFGQLIYISPEYDIVAVKLSTWPDFLDIGHETNARRAIHAIAAAV